MKTGLGQDTWNLWGLKPLSKHYASGFAKSALETEDHVPKAEHIDQIKSCLLRDDLRMRAHLHSKGHLTPALKEIRRTRVERLLQWHAENVHENILFTDEKLFTIAEQYKNQKKIYAQTSLEVCSEGAGRPSTLLRHGLVRGCHQGVTHLHFCNKGVKLVSECIKRTCRKKVRNILTWPSSVVRNGSSSRTQFLHKSQDDSRMTAEERSGIYQRRGLALGESRPQPPGP